MPACNLPIEALRHELTAPIIDPQGRPKYELPLYYKPYAGRTGCNRLSESPCDLSVGKYCDLFRAQTVRTLLSVQECYNVLRTRTAIGAFAIIAS